MEITDVRLKKTEDEDSKIKATSSITIDGCFVVHDVKVIEGDNGLFVTMPSKKMPDNKYKDIAHPINTETRNMIQKIVLDKYNEE